MPPRARADGAQAAGRPLPRRFRLQRMPLQADGASKLHVASYEAPADKGKDPVKPRGLVGCLIG